MPHAHASGFPSPCVLLSDRITPVGQEPAPDPFVIRRAQTTEGNTHHDDGDRGGQAPALR